MHKPRKRFGQHFLKDPYVIAQILSVIYPKSQDTLVEIGPGKGALTFELLALYPELIAIEVDRDLAAYLKSRQPGLNLIVADVLKFDFNLLLSSTSANTASLMIMGNLPYNISTPLLFKLLNYKTLIKNMTFMLQKEVVNRMCAKINTKDYGRLTVMLQHDFEIELLFDVSNNAFDPPPKVDSAIVRLVPKLNSSKIMLPQQYAWFEKIVRHCFQYRRKTLRSSLKKLNFAHDFGNIATLSIDFNCRPENLSVEQFVELAGYLQRLEKLS